MTTRRGVRKRIFLMLLLTAAAIGGMLLYRANTRAKTPVLQTVTVTRTTVVNTAVCTGTVQACDGIEVCVSVPCVAGEVVASVGDTVKKGDVLLTVDAVSTMAMAMSAGLTQQTDVTLAASALPQTVTAPSDGVVGAVNAKAGELLDPSSPCVVLSQGGGVQIDIVIRESAVPKIAVGQTVAVSGVAFDKDEYHGVVTYIADSARSLVSATSSETVLDAVVSLIPEDIDDSLLVGLSAKAAVTVGEREGVLLVPYEAVTENGDEAFVYTVTDQTVRRCAVTLGEETAQGIEILDGVTDGDTVIRDTAGLDSTVYIVKTGATT